MDRNKAEKEAIRMSMHDDGVYLVVFESKGNYQVYMESKYVGAEELIVGKFQSGLLVVE